MYSKSSLFGLLFFVWEIFHFGSIASFLWRHLSPPPPLPPLSTILTDRNILEPISHPCLMSDVWCLISDVWCLMSVTQNVSHPSSIRSTIHEAEHVKVKRFGILTRSSARFSGRSALPYSVEYINARNGKRRSIPQRKKNLRKNIIFSWRNLTSKKNSEYFFNFFPKIFFTLKFSIKKFSENFPEKFLIENFNVKNMLGKKLKKYSDFFFEIKFLQEKIIFFIRFFFSPRYDPPLSISGVYMLYRIRQCGTAGKTCRTPSQNAKSLDFYVLCFTWHIPDDWLISQVKRRDCIVLMFADFVQNISLEKCLFHGNNNQKQLLPKQVG